MDIVALLASLSNKVKQGNGIIHTGTHRLDAQTQMEEMAQMYTQKHTATHR